MSENDEHQRLEFAARRGLEAALLEMSRHLPLQEDEVLPTAMRRTQALRQAADDYIPAIIAWFRQDLGTTWEQVGELLGVSRQAAWERYHDRVAELESRGESFAKWTRERMVWLEQDDDANAAEQGAS